MLADALVSTSHFYVKFTSQLTVVTEMHERERESVASSEKRPVVPNWLVATVKGVEIG